MSKRKRWDMYAATPVFASETTAEARSRLLSQIYKKHNVAAIGLLYDYFPRGCCYVGEIQCGFNLKKK